MEGSVSSDGIPLCEYVQNDLKEAEISGSLVFSA